MTQEQNNFQSSDTAFTSEAICAVCGVERILSEDIKPPSQAEMGRAVKLAKTLQKRIVDLIDTLRPSLQMNPPTLPDYRTTNQALAKKIDGNRLAEFLFSVPANLHPACTMVCSNMVNYLDSIIPRQSRDGITGIKLEEPSKGEFAEFGWAWRIANDPMVVISLMTDGMLIGAEVTHVKAMFPELYSRMGAAVLDAISDRAATETDWLPPWWLQKQIYTLLNVSPISRSLVADIEGAVHADQQQKEQRARDIQIHADTSTQTQRLANK